MASRPGRRRPGCSRRDGDASRSTHKSTPRVGPRGGDPVGVDQRAVHDHVGVPGRLGRQQRPVQRRLPCGEHRDGLVAVVVGGRQPDVVVAGQLAQAGVVEQPAQRQHGLLVGAQRPPVPYGCPRRPRSACSRADRNRAQSSDTSRTAVYAILTPPRSSSTVSSLYRLPLVVSAQRSSSYLPRRVAPPATTHNNRSFISFSFLFERLEHHTCYLCQLSTHFESPLTADLLFVGLPTAPTPILFSTSHLPPAFRLDTPGALPAPHPSGDEC